MGWNTRPIAISETKPAAGWIKHARHPKRLAWTIGQNFDDAGADAERADLPKKYAVFLDFVTRPAIHK